MCLKLLVKPWWTNLKFNKVYSHLILVLMLGIGSLVSWAFSAQPLLASDSSRMQQLDYEIGLLQAEIAMRRGERDTFLHHYNQLNQMPALTEFELRWQLLLEQAKRLDWVGQESNNLPRKGFHQAALADRITLVAPFSGELAPAGLALQQVLLDQFRHKVLSFVDTQQQTSASLVAEIEASRADLLIILHRREDTVRLAQHFRGIPSVLFHPPGFFDPGMQRVLHPNYELQAMMLKAWLSDLTSSRITWLQTQGVSNQLVNRVNQELSYPLQPLVVQSNAQLNDLVAARFGNQQSLGRQQWLARVIEQPLTGIGRSRQDQALVIFYGPMEQAMLLRPLLEYHQQDLPILWVPSELPDVGFFSQNLARWQETFALLPNHFMTHLTENSEENEEDGLFFALGEVVVELIRRSKNTLPDQFEFQGGNVLISERGEFSLGQHWYRIDRSLKRLNDTNQQD